MTTPYGEISYGENTFGFGGRYSVALSKNVELEALTNYARRDIGFRDVGTNIYNWDGTRGRVVGRNGQRGELGREAIDKSVYEDAVFGRLLLSWTVAPGHIVRATTSPQLAWRMGDDHIVERPDLLRLEQRVSQLTSGIEYESTFFGDRLSNVVFGKSYVFSATAQDRGPVTGDTIERDRDIHRVGGGDALRYRFTPWFLGKLSYEYATRLPRADELFGDGVLIEASANEYQDRLLKPEVSHNINIGPRLDVKTRSVGAFLLDVNGFVRQSDDMIVFLAGRQFSRYVNLYDARALGIDASGAWTSPGSTFRIDSSFTWQDIRNTSSEGPFEAQEGLRIPSRPWLFASWGARARVFELADSKGALDVFYMGRYVHGFDRGWDIGDPQYKMSVAGQTSHSAGVTWLLSHADGRFTSTLEVDNLANAKLYDVYGVQRPGRAIYLKLTGRI